MFPSAVVPTLDILKGGQLSCSPRGKASMVCHLALKYLEKALGNRIVPTVSFATHTLLNRQTLQFIPKFSASILDAPVRMKYKLAIYSSVYEGHTPSCYTRTHCFHTIAHGPANHFSVGQIQNYC